MNSINSRRLLGVAIGFTFLLMLAIPNLTAASSQDKMAKKEKSVTVTGCLQSGAQDGQFTLSANGKTYQLTSSGTTSLKDHVGHKVTIKGKLMPGETEGSGGEIQVSSLTMISQSCT